MSNSLAQTAAYAQSEHYVLAQQRKRARLACVLKQNMRCYSVCDSSSKLNNGRKGTIDGLGLKEPYPKESIVLDYDALDILD